MRYPILIELGDDHTAFGVIVPDLPGCFSAGDTLDEAIDNSVEAIELYLEAIAPSLGTNTAATSIQQHQANPDYAQGTWVLVDIDLSKLRGKTKRYNITASERAMRVVDLSAKQAGESRSEFLMRAATMRAEGEYHHHKRRHPE